MSTMSLPKTANLNHPFLVVDENRFAFEALVRLIGRGSEDANLVTLQGTSGSGKTHLTKEFLEDYLNLRPQLNYRFVNAGDLGTQFMSAAQHRDRSRNFMLKFDDMSIVSCWTMFICCNNSIEVQRFVTGLIDRMTQNGGSRHRHNPQVVGRTEQNSRTRLISRLRCGVYAKTGALQFSKPRTITRSFFHNC